MQVIPYIFALVMAAVFILARMGQENLGDQLVIKAIQDRTTSQLKLLKKGELGKCFERIKIQRAPASMEVKKRKKTKSARPEFAITEYEKLSLKVFSEPIDELTYQFIHAKLFHYFETTYPGLVDPDFFELLLKIFKETQETKLCQIKLPTEEDQKKYYKLLIHPLHPLEETCTLISFSKNALFNYYKLKLDLFYAIFGQTEASGLLEEEMKLKESGSKPIFSKEKIGALFPQLIPDWSRVAIDRLISFSNKEELILRVCSNQDSDFFYFKRN